MRPRRPSGRLEARLFGPAPEPGHVPAAAWFTPAAACALLLAVLWPGWSPLTVQALGGGFDFRDWRGPAVVLAGPVNTVHRGSFSSTNAAVPVAFASLLLGQTNFLNR